MMKCKFIDKFIDKIYSGSLNFLERQVLDSHMKKCSTCREFYDNCMEENLNIKEALECIDVPSGIGINVIRSIDHNKYRKLKVMRMRKYAVAAVAVVLLASTLCYLNLSGKLSFSDSILSSHPSLTYQQNQELEGILENYLKEKEGSAEHGGQLFATVEILGIKTSSIIDGTLKVYTYATIGEYHDSGYGYYPEQVAKKTFPAVVIVRQRGSSYTPVSYEVPDKNGNLTDNLKELYKDYGDKMTKKAAQDLENLNTQKAESDFMPSDSTALQKNIKSFVINFAFTPKSFEYKLKVKIPSTFKDKPRDFPLGLYWAYSNLLSKDAGLDMSSYKGTEVTAHIVPLKDEYWEGPNKDLRAIVIESGGKIIGGWLDKGTCGSPCASLKKNYFKELAGKSWGQWLEDEGLVDYSEGLEAQLKKLSPEEVIEKSYSSINKKDDSTAHAIYSKYNQFQFLFMNMDNRKLYNDGWNIPTVGNQVLSSVKVSKIELYNNPSRNPTTVSTLSSDTNLFNRHISQVKEYMVEANEQYTGIGPLESGMNTTFIILVKETPESPWEFDGGGTGP